MSLEYVNKNYLVADLVNNLVTWSNFSFEGANPKHIKVQYCGRDTQCGNALLSMPTSDVNPLIVWIDPNLCKL